MTRWNVERRKDDFEDVGFEHMIVFPSGALGFTDDGLEDVELVYAPGSWITVSREVE